MKITEKQNGLVEIAVGNAGNALHLIGTDSYTVNGKASVRAVDVDKWEECPMPPYSKTEYEAKVAEMVREKYSESEEFALQRKAINAMINPDAIPVDADGTPSVINSFNEYNRFVEQCKQRAAAMLSERQDSPGEGAV